VVDSRSQASVLDSVLELQTVAIPSRPQTRCPNKVRPKRVPKGSAAKKGCQRFGRPLVGQAVDSFVRVGRQRVYDGGIQTSLLHDPVSGSTLATSTGSDLRYMVIDGVGNTTASFDSAGSVQSSAVYDVWGVLRAGSEDPWTSFGAQPAAESGVRLLGYRYYFPVWGRFLSEEPLPGLSKTIPEAMLYSYVGNSPAVYWDPLGLKTSCHSESTREKVNPAFEETHDTGWWRRNTRVLYFVGVEDNPHPGPADAPRMFGRRPPSRRVPRLPVPKPAGPNNAVISRLAAMRLGTHRNDADHLATTAHRHGHLPQ
jgi:RHS repeat-associated protein